MSSTIEVADDTQIKQLAAYLEKSPSELRALMWQKIADTDVPLEAYGRC